MLNVPQVRIKKGVAFLLPAKDKKERRNEIKSAKETNRKDKHKENAEFFIHRRACFSDAEEGGLFY